MDLHGGYFEHLGPTLRYCFEVVSLYELEQKEATGIQLLKVTHTPSSNL